MHLADTLRVIKRSGQGGYEVTGGMAPSWAPFANILVRCLAGPHGSVKDASRAVSQLLQELAALKKAEFPPGYSEGSYRLQWIIRCLVLVRLCCCDCTASVCKEMTHLASLSGWQLLSSSDLADTACAGGHPQGVFCKQHCFVDARTCVCCVPIKKASCSKWLRNWTPLLRMSCPRLGRLGDTNMATPCF